MVKRHTGKLTTIWLPRSDGNYQRYRVRNPSDHPDRAPPDLARQLTRAANRGKSPNNIQPTRAPSGSARATPVRGSAAPSRPSGAARGPPTPPAGAAAPARAKARSGSGAGATRARALGREPHAFDRRRGAGYSTWFKAVGTDNLLREMHGAAPSPGLLQEDLEFAPAPAAFYSNEGAVLGRVKWDGVLDVEELIAMLNDRLQFAGEEVPDFDFRRDYAQWEYTYRVRENIGGTVSDVLVIRWGRPQPPGAGVRVRGKKINSRYGAGPA